MKKINFYRGQNALQGWAVFICMALATALSGQNQSPDTPGSYTETVKGVSFKMVVVQGGTFEMGCTGEQGEECYNSEKPVHKVTLSDYKIGETEVTQALWVAVMGDNPSEFNGCDECPVEMVSWEDAQAFIAKLNGLTGKKYRLPTEAEWEYAARGGGQSRGYKYSGGNEVAEVAWYAAFSGGNSDDRTHEVKALLPNELVLYDMSGNVWEWCSDWVESYSAAPQTNPSGPEEGSVKVLRGGGWDDAARYCRVSVRLSCGPTYHRGLFGLRLASQ